MIIATGACRHRAYAQRATSVIYIKTPSASAEKSLHASIRVIQGLRSSARAAQRKTSLFVSKKYISMDRNRAITVLREFNGLIHGGEIEKIHEASINVGIRELGEALDMAIDQLRRRK